MRRFAMSMMGLLAVAWLGGTSLAGEGDPVILANPPIIAYVGGSRVVELPPGLRGVEGSPAGLPGYVTVRINGVTMYVGEGNITADAGTGDVLTYADLGITLEAGTPQATVETVTLPSSRYGVEVGDVILAVNDIELPSSGSFGTSVRLPDTTETLTLTVQTGTNSPRQVFINVDTGIIDLGILPESRNAGDAVVVRPGGLAQQAQVTSGTTVWYFEINGGTPTHLPSGRINTAGLTFPATVQMQDFFYDAIGQPIMVPE